MFLICENKYNRTELAGELLLPIFFYESMIVIATKPCVNWIDSLKQKALIELCIAFFNNGEKICIIKNEKDYLGLYKTWFPQSFIVELEDNESIKYFQEKISVNKIWAAYLVSQLVKAYLSIYTVSYFGKSSQLLQYFFNKRERMSIQFETNKISNNCNMCQLFIVDDDINQESLKDIFQYFENTDKNVLILFLNTYMRYLFYQTAEVSNIAHVIPIGIEEVRGGDDSVEEKLNYVIYAYSKNDAIRKTLLSFRVELSLQNVGVFKSVDNIEVMFLRGMLDAVERKLLCLEYNPTIQQ